MTKNTTDFKLYYNPRSGFWKILDKEKKKK